MEDVAKKVGTSELREAARRVMCQFGGQPRRLRGKAECWELDRNGAREIFSVKTTRDRWFGFQPPDRAGNWGAPLDRAQSVLVAALNDFQNPTRIEVYQFPTDEVRAGLDKKWAGEIANGRGRHAAWLHLDALAPDRQGSEGSGLAQKYPPVALFRLGEFLTSTTQGDEAVQPGQPERMALQTETVSTDPPPPPSLTAATAKAKADLAATLGVSPDAIEIIIRT